MNFYSQETLQQAFSANKSYGTLHREMITVADAIESYEEQKFYTEHQNDNQSSSL